MIESGGILGVAPCARRSGDGASGIYQLLREMVLGHRFLPGQRLDQRQLAKQLGVSTTLIRDAFTRLAAGELLNHIPSKGFFVKPLNASDMAEAYELTTAVLSFSIDKSLSGFTLDGLRDRPALERAAQDAVPRVPLEIARQYGAFIEALFERIVLLSGNRLAVRALRVFLDRTHYVRERDLLDPAYLRAVDTDMTALQAALLSGESRDAVAAIRRLLERKMARLPDLVKKVQLEDLRSAAAALNLLPDD